VRGYKEEGTTTTPFDMTVLNNIDRFQLAYDAIRRIARLQPIAASELDRLEDTHQRHKAFVMQYGEDLPEVRHWKWTL
jgi:xylulose-5-phosphate/fructose-6-phosphate phosphoketolase